MSMSLLAMAEMAGKPLRAVKDPLYRLTRADRTNPGTTPPNQWTWNYDQVGNRTSAQKDSEATTSSYNEKNQLLGTAGGGKMLWRGTLDEPGNVNLTSAAASINGQPARMLAGNVFEAELNLPTGANTVTIQAQDGSGNVATKNYSVNVTGAPTSYTYDANGNLATKTETSILGQQDVWSYAFNALNQLTSVAKNSVSQAAYFYDPVGRRVERVSASTSTRWTYDAEDVVRQTTGQAETLFLHGPQVDEHLAMTNAAGVLTFLHADALQSIVRHTDGAAGVMESLTYDTWGNVQSGTPGLYAFTGREWDSSSQLLYYRSRWYEPREGRFISEDPVYVSARPQIEFDAYAYAAGRPTTFTDPSGTTYIDCIKKIAELMLALEKMRERLEQQANGSKDPVVIKNHQKSIEQLSGRIRELAEQAAKHCKEAGKKAAGMAASMLEAIPRCAMIFVNPCVLRPDLCCNGTFTGGRCEA